jgi:hypothetical protein
MDPLALMSSANNYIFIAIETDIHWGLLLCETVQSIVVELCYFYHNSLTLFPKNFIPKGNESISSQNLCVNIHSCIICNNPKVEATQKFISGQMDKQNMIYP